MSEASPTLPAVYDATSSTLRAVSRKELKAQELLFGLIRLYIATGRAIGSETLKGELFQHLSSATIRNYFSLLDKEGLLEQVHTSGGRIPTDLAWRRYFDLCSTQPMDSSTLRELEQLFAAQPAAYPGSIRRGQPLTHEALYDYLRYFCDQLSQWSMAATFLSAPVFEQDHLAQLHLWPFQQTNWIAVTRSQMGFFRHELLSVPPVLTATRAPVFEACLEAKIHNPMTRWEGLSHEEQRALNGVYQELMVRQLLQHSHGKERLWLRSGLSQLLHYPELSDPQEVSRALGFFDHSKGKERLFHHMQSAPITHAWIGHELAQLFCDTPECCLMATPFFVHQRMVGIVGVVGPRRMNYQRIRQTLEYAARLITHHLTREYYLFRLPYQPNFSTSSKFRSLP